MEVDDPGPSDPHNNEEFMLKVRSSERTFLNYCNSQTFLRCVNREILQKMCENRGLPNDGTKKDLYARLDTWVCSSPLVGVRVIEGVFFSVIPTIPANGPLNRIPRRGGSLGKTSCRLSGVI